MIRLFTLFLAVPLFVSLQAAPDWVPVFNDKPLKPGEVAAIKSAIPHEPIVAPKTARRVLIFSATQVARHRSIAHGKVAFTEMGLATGAFTTVVSDDPANFESEVLKTFDTIIMLNPTWDFFMPNKEQKKQFNASELSALKARQQRLVNNLVNYVKQGGGLVGIHAASDSCYGHQGYGEMIGGYFDGHPWRARNNVTLVVEDPTHAVMQPVFEGMKDFSLVEEIYQYRNNSFSRERSRVLLHLDTARSDEVTGMKRQDGDYPVAWVQAVGKGRVFYTNIGHNPHIFSNPLMLKHYLAGIQFATGDLVADTTPSGPLEHVQTTYTWTGEHGDSLFKSDNWSPAKEWGGGDVLRFAGREHGRLDLTYSGGQQARVLYEFTDKQSDDVSIRLNHDTQSRAFAIGLNNRDTAISIAAGAGQVTFDGQDATTQMVALFGSAQPWKKNFYIKNEGSLEFGKYTILKRGAESGDHTLMLRGGGQTTIRGTIGSFGFGGGLLVDHEHRLTLAGTYSEGAKQALFINNGTVEFTSAAALAGDRASWEPIRVGNNVKGFGTLRYTGSEEVHIDRRIQIGNGVSGANQVASARIENESASGQLIFDNTRFNEPQSNAVAARTLTLAGSNSQNNEITGKISDNSTKRGGIVGLIKAGSGQWILSGSNSYTGATLVEQGTLAIGAAAAISHSSWVMIGEGAILDVTALTDGLLLAEGQSLGGTGTLRGDLTLADGMNLIFHPKEPLTVTGDVKLSDTFTVADLINADQSAVNWQMLEDGVYTLIESEKSNRGKIQLQVRAGEAVIL